MSELKEEDFVGLSPQDMEILKHAAVYEVPSPIKPQELPDECCGRCKYFSHRSAQCHRYPPQLMLFWSNPERPDGKSCQWTCTWPNTNAELYCGEFKTANPVKNAQ